MIVGNGLIANSFKPVDSNDVVFFASGVSNSLENDEKEFKREERLIKITIEQNREKIFVYFSTCSIYDSSKKDSPYVNHKLKMEQFIKNSCEKFYIIRVSNAVGKGGNKNTLMNFLTESILQNKPITIHTKATRNFIDIEDIKNITLLVLEKKIKNHIINIAYPHNFFISEIVNEIERFYNIKASKTFENQGIDYSIELDFALDYFQQIDKINYINRLLLKYYQK